MESRKIESVHALTPPDVLKRIRDSGPITLAALAESLRVGTWPPLSVPHSGATGVFVGPFVEQLRDANLVVTTPAPKGRWALRSIPSDELTLKVSPAWQPIQNALGISLSEAAMRWSDPLVVRVRPVFGPAQIQPGGKRLFAVMPFAGEMRDVFDRCIRPAALACGLQPYRADDFFSAGVIMTEIWSAICQSVIVVADCTGRNANVFYEMGIAHTVGVPTVLMTQSVKDLASDLMHRRAIVYEPTDLGLQTAQFQLENAIKTELLSTANARKLEAPINSGERTEK